MRYFILCFRWVQIPPWVVVVGIVTLIAVLMPNAHPALRVMALFGDSEAEAALVVYEVVKAQDSAPRVVSTPVCTMLVAYSGEGVLPEQRPVRSPVDLMPWLVVKTVRGWAPVIEPVSLSESAALCGDGGNEVRFVFSTLPNEALHLKPLQQ